MIFYFQLQAVKETKWFDVQSKKLSNGQERNKARYDHGCVKIAKTSQHKGQILVVGGSYSSSTIESLEIGDNRWKIVERTDPEKKLISHALTESYSSNYIEYLIGGRSVAGVVKPV